MGQYDVPAFIEYVLAATGRSQLSFVGHSLGCGVFFIAMTQRPDLQASVDVMIALAPSAATRNYRNYLLLLKPLIRVLRPTLKAIGLKRILSNDPPVRQATRLLCEWTYVMTLAGVRPPVTVLDPIHLPTMAAH